MARLSKKLLIACAIPLLTLSGPQMALGQEWDERVRGSWVRTGEAQVTDVVLVEPGKACQVVVLDDAHSAVKQAATFLASDITKLTGAKAHFNDQAPPKGQVSIRLVTLGDGTELPPGIQVDKLTDQWEAYQILTTPETVWCVGSDARGTAFAAYRLSEHLGIDPLYIWSGITPEVRDRLVMKQTDEFVGSPTVKYRGMFHDDEDILGRPFEPDSGYPMRIGNVPNEWYARFFETALRLRMNMVAPYTRVHRRFEVQKMASDWGLFYTSHHYDILLSNPFGYGNFRLAEKRGVTGNWDWITNKENMIKYWRAGVEENGALDAIWPVGLRGTDDVGYNFPKDMPESEQNKIFQDVINAQREVTKENVADDKKPPVFHFTLYGEMLDKFLAGGGKFDMPEDVIIIWPDDNDGRIRALPKDPGKWKHGVYYHLAYWGPVAKQSMNIVPPKRIAVEFKKIIEGGATEYMLVNVSELREYIREARMIAEICWDAKAALHDTPLLPMPDPILPHVPTELKDRPLPPDVESKSADRYNRWFCAEYFGEDAAEDAAEAFKHYNAILPQWWSASWAGDHVPRGLNTLRKKLAGEEWTPAGPNTLKALREFEARCREAFIVIERAKSKMNREQRQFFFEICELPLSAQLHHAQAAILVVEAIDEKDPKKILAMCEKAMEPLEQLELDLLRAERPPFEKWYRDTFIRHPHTGHSMHHPYYELRTFVTSDGKQRHIWPESHRRPNLQPFVPLLASE